MQTVYELRKSGYKVRVSHQRYYANYLLARHKAGKLINHLTAKGGMTLVELTSPTGINVLGCARCSKKDNFNRKMGLNVALGRALAILAKTSVETLGITQVH